MSPVDRDRITVAEAHAIIIVLVDVPGVQFRRAFHELRLHTYGRIVLRSRHREAAHAAIENSYFISAFVAAGRPMQHIAGYFPAFAAVVELIPFVVLPAVENAVIKIVGDNIRFRRIIPA